MILTEEIAAGCYEAQVSKYIDGDTLDMNVYLGFDTYVIKRIRLLNIDAPEIHNTKKTSTEYKKGEVAKLTLIEFMIGAAGTYYLYAEHKGLYGRWLGEIWRAVGEASLNDHMIAKGYYNGGWTWETQQALIEAWYSSEAFHRYGSNIFLDRDTDRLDKGI